MPKPNTSCSPATPCGCSTSSSRMLTRRSALKFTAASAGLALLAACQPSAQISSVSPTSAPPPPIQPTASAPTQAVATVNPTVPAAAAAQPKTGGTLRTAILADVLSLDGHILTGSGRDSFF